MPKLAKKKNIPKDKVDYRSEVKINLRTRKSNLLRRLKNTFKKSTAININSLRDAKCIFTRSQLPPVIDENIFFISDTSEVDVAFLKKALTNEFLATLEKSFKKAFKARMEEPGGREKNTIYSGVWGLMSPTNYVPTDHNNPSGAIIINEVLCKITPIAEQLLQIISPSTLNEFKQLPTNAKICNSLIPCSATNFLLENIKHRIINPHLDNNDLELSMLVYAGDMNAPLRLVNQNSTINTERGDILIFKGSKLCHSVNDDMIAFVLPENGCDNDDKIDFTNDDDFSDEEYNIDFSDSESIDESISDTNDEDVRMRISLVLFGHKSLKTKPIFHLPKKQAIAAFDKMYPDRAKDREIRRNNKKNKVRN